MKVSEKSHLQLFSNMQIYFNLKILGENGYWLKNTDLGLAK